jgi:hypothetical protein
MRALSSALLPFFLLAGCAGYVVDHVRPSASIVGPQLTRYGLDARETRCVSDRLGATLTPQQLGRLARTAALVTEGWFEPPRLTMRDLLHVASQFDDAQVAQELARAVDACGAGAMAAAVAEAGAAESAPAAPVAAAPVAPSATWLNLGAAPTGQAISVDASSIERQANSRQAWFRLTNPGASAPTGITYLLRIDCEARTLSPLAERRQDAAGAVSEHRDYGAGEQGPLPIEGGTVMEIAYLALCT